MSKEESTGQALSPLRLYEHISFSKTPGRVLKEVRN